LINAKQNGKRSLPFPGLAKTLVEKPFGRLVGPIRLFWPFIIAKHAVVAACGQE